MCSSSRSKPAASARSRRGDELVADRVQVRAGHLARHLVDALARTAAATARSAASCRRRAARPRPPTAASSSPCGPAWPELRADRAGVLVHEVDDPLPRRRRARRVYRPPQPGVIRPSADVQIISVITSPAPPIARAPRCTRWKSPGVPSTERVHVHRRDDDAVPSSSAAQAQRREHRRRVARPRRRSPGRASAARRT